jgi:hypothetical protein
MTPFTLRTLLRWNVSNHPKARKIERSSVLRLWILCRCSERCGRVCSISFRHRTKVSSQTTVFSQCQLGSI